MSTTAFTNLTAATVEGWVKWSRFGNFSRVFEFGVVGDQSRGMRLNNQVTDLDLSFNIYETRQQGHGIRIARLLSSNQWCHIVAVSGPGGMKLYFNGLLAGTDPFTGSFAAITTRQANFLGHSARTEQGNGIEDFQGQMDEVRVCGGGGARRSKSARA